MKTMFRIGTLSLLGYATLAFGPHHAFAFEPGDLYCKGQQDIPPAIPGCDDPDLWQTNACRPWEYTVRCFQPDTGINVPPVLSEAKANQTFPDSVNQVWASVWDPTWFTDSGERVGGCHNSKPRCWLSTTGFESIQYEEGSTIVDYPQNISMMTMFCRCVTD